MFTVFGWVKERREVGHALDCYCYGCQSKRPWEHWRETEWVSFFGVKTIPFLWKEYILCSACRDPVLLSRAQARLLGNPAGLSGLEGFLETHQLAQKTEIQWRFLLAQRLDAESRAREPA